MELKGLDNTAAAIDYEFAKSSSTAIRLLRAGKAAVDGGEHGAISLWYDDDRKLRGSRCVRWNEVELKTFRTQALAMKWYRGALKKIR